MADEWRLSRGAQPDQGADAFAGSLFSTSASVSLSVGAANSRFPVSISWSTTPKAHTSARLSTGWPRACSGAM
jgi:hypothetical protein